MVPLTEANAERIMSQGVLSLESLPGPGRHRLATRSDRALLLQWMREFHREVHPVETFDEGRIVRTVEMRIGGDPSAAFWLWEDEDEPVSASGYGGKTLNGIRIGPVYTPPQHRGRGTPRTWWPPSRSGCSTAATGSASSTRTRQPHLQRRLRRIGRQVAESAQYTFTSG